MEYIPAILLGVCFFGLAFCLWALTANENTAKEKGKLIEFVFDQPDWERLCDEMRAVSYDDHFRARLFLRNPWELYSDRIRKVMDR